MKVLVVGSGGREHAMAWKLRQELYGNDELFVAPGNAGTAAIARNVDIQPNDILGLTRFAKEKSMDITFVGPEETIALGFVDSLEKEGLRAVGPSRAAAELEWRKTFAYEFMERHDIPRPESYIVDTPEWAVAIGDYFLRNDGVGVIKADGLAAGKGVTIYRSKTELKNAIGRLAMKRGEKALMQKFLKGQEASFIGFTDGENFIPMPHTQDHKQIFNDNEGPNTGGMGAYARTPIITPEIEHDVMRRIIAPTLDGMANEGRKYKGILYVGLMISDGKPYVLEYNCRGGDPETQPAMALMRSNLLEIGYGTAEGGINRIKPLWSPEYAVTVVLASKGYPSDEYKKHLNREISGLGRNDVIEFHAGTIKLPDGRIVTSGGRVLGVTALDKTLSGAIVRAYSAIGKGNNGIYFDGMHYRTDIAAKGLQKN